MSTLQSQLDKTADTITDIDSTIDSGTGGIGPSDEAGVVTHTDGPVSPDGAEHNNNGETHHIDNQTDHDQSGDGHEHEQSEPDPEPEPEHPIED